MIHSSPRSKRIEHSSWVAEPAFVYRPFSSSDALHRALMKCIRDASHEEQIALFNVPPKLAGREAIAGQMTAELSGEQGRLGLTALSAAELAELTTFTGGSGSGPAFRLSRPCAFIRTCNR